MAVALLMLSAVGAQAANDKLSKWLRVAEAVLGTGAVLQEDFEFPKTGTFITYRAGQTFYTARHSWKVESGSVDAMNARARNEVTASDGQQLMELAGSPGPGVISTAFETRAGKTYTLTLHYAHNSGLLRKLAHANVDVQGASGTSLLHTELLHDPAKVPFNAPLTYTGSFVADGTKATLRLTSLNAGEYGLTVDAISITPSAAASAPATSETASTTPAGAVVSGGAAAAGAAASMAIAEDKPAFMIRCKRETSAQFAGAARQADSICRSKWDMVTASAPIVDAMLAAAPATGARFDAVAARTQATAVRWNAKPAAGQLASGRLKDIQVGIANSPAPGMSFDWFKGGEPIPFDLPEALKVRGLGVSMIGCFSFGAAEGGRVYRVQAPGKAPFAVSINFREAALASQSSTFNAAADFSGRLPTLASLKRDGNDWSATCPQ